MATSIPINLASPRITWKQLLRQGLWYQNPALVQLLGLCPLLAVTNTAVNALGLGIATLCVLMGSNVCISVLRPLIPHSLRLPMFVLVIASWVSMAQLFMQAYHYELYQSLGIFLALITTNCAILGRAEAFAYQNPVLPALFDGFTQGLGFLWVLLLLGSIRELIGQGTLFAQASSMLGAWGTYLTLDFSHYYAGFLLALLPPGAFIIVGLLLALKNYLTHKDAHLNEQ